MSDELIVCWNGSNISKYDSIVMQALNLHFKSGPWYFTSTNVQSQMHKSFYSSGQDKPYETCFFMSQMQVLVTTDGKLFMCHLSKLFTLA